VAKYGDVSCFLTILRIRKILWNIQSIVLEIQKNLLAILKHFILKSFPIMNGSAECTVAQYLKHVSPVEIGFHVLSVLLISHF